MKTQLFFIISLLISFSSFAQKDFQKDEQINICKIENLKIDSISHSYIGISWQENEWNFTIKYTKGSDINWDSAISLQTSNNSILIEDLLDNENYKLFIKAYCSEDEYAFSDTITFTTLCNNYANTLPYYENFDLLSTGNTPNCWFKISSSSRPSIDGGEHHSGTKSLAFVAENQENSYAIMPLIDEDITLLKINFFVLVENYSKSGTLTLGIMSNPYDTSSFIPITQIQLNSNWSWKPIEVSFSDVGATNKNYHIAFKYNSNYTLYFLWVDDIEVSYNEKATLFTSLIDNNWFNEANWSNSLPNTEKIAIIPSNKKVIIPKDSVANAKKIIIKDNFLYPKSEVLALGEINSLEKIDIEASFKGYNADTNNNGWYLFGVPIKINDTIREALPSIFNPKIQKDDLYLWNEQDDVWENFQVLQNREDFFDSQQRGYLLSYQNNTKILFNGDLLSDSSYILLNDASISNPINKRGWHLSYNPYPFAININQLTRNNVSLPQLLDNETSNYRALHIEDAIIPPFSGFMVQVTNNENSLVINKNQLIDTFNSDSYSLRGETQERDNPSTEENQIISLNIASSMGKDKAYLMFLDGTSLNYDVKFDNRKLEGLSLSPQISFLIDGEPYSFNAIPPVEDSILIDVYIDIKTPDNYTISLNKGFEDSFSEISLYNKITNQKQINFLEDSIYSFFSPIFSGDKFQLKIVKTSPLLENTISLQENFLLKQDKDLITIETNAQIKNMELFNIKGQKVNSSIKHNTIKIPQKGCFILKVQTKNNNYKRKIIYL
ncbi:MAG: hypothetical protein LBM25_02545 [Bacteroidales bacterium]|jgi:hypothetical protein|nr:hypothetical protein [Bacteroidales bacterium]